MKNSNRRPFAIYLLTFLLFLLGFGAVYSGAALMLAPDGSLMQMPLYLIERSPFHSYFIPGAILFLFVGVYPLGIAFGIWKKPAWKWPNTINPFKLYHWGWAGSLAAGVIVVLWLSTELLWVGYSFLHTIYYVWAGLILLIALLPSVRRYLKVD